MSANLSGLLNHAAARTTAADTAVLDYISCDLQLVPGFVPVVDVAEDRTAEGRNAGAHLAFSLHLLFYRPLRTRSAVTHAQR